jgi:signal transduction histidine kinase
MVKENLLSYIEKLNNTRATARGRVMAIVIVTLIGQPLLILSTPSDPHFSMALASRWVHFAIAFAIFIYLLSHKMIPRKLSYILFTCTTMPIAFNIWFNYMGFIATGVPNLTFASTHLLFFSIALFYSGSFLLNLSFMLFFALEILVLWMSYTSNFDSKEPYFILMIIFVNTCMLFFRYLDERTYRRYLKETYRVNMLENFARVLLTFRDKANSPVQSLVFLSKLRKDHKNLNDSQWLMFNSSINQLKGVTDQLKAFEEHVPWNKDVDPLMAKKETEEWLASLKKDQL